MDDCYFIKGQSISAFLNKAAFTIPEKRMVVASERLSEESSYILRMLNTTYGIWYHESHVLYNKSKLQEALHKLVEELRL